MTIGINYFLKKYSDSDGVFKAFVSGDIDAVDHRCIKKILGLEYYKEACRLRAERIMSPQVTAVKDTGELLLLEKLSTLLNSVSRESNSDTPDFILAEYIRGALEIFEKAVVRRDDWYGVDHWNSTAKIDE